MTSGPREEEVRHAQRAPRGEGGRTLAVAESWRKAWGGSPSEATRNEPVGTLISVPGPRIMRKWIRFQPPACGHLSWQL